MTEEKMAELTAIADRQLEASRMAEELDLQALKRVCKWEWSDVDMETLVCIGDCSQCPLGDVDGEADCGDVDWNLLFDLLRGVSEEDL